MRCRASGWRIEGLPEQADLTQIDMQNFVPAVIQSDELKAADQVILFDEIETFVQRRCLAHIRKAGGLAVVMDVPADDIVATAGPGLRQFSWHLFPYSRRMASHDKALDSVLDAFNHLVRAGRVPSGPLAQLYRTDDISFAFKKTLVLRLRSFFAAADAAVCLNGECGSVRFVPSAGWLRIRDYLQAAGLAGLIPDLDAVLDPSADSGGWRGVTVRVRLRVEGLAKIALVPFYVLSKVRHVACQTRPDASTRIGVRLYPADLGLRDDGMPGVDWLIDGTNIKSDDVLFVSEYDLPPAYAAALAHRGYNHLPYSRANAFKKTTLGVFFGTFLGRNLWFLPQILAAGLRAEIYFLKDVFSAWVDFLRWTNFVRFKALQHYVTYNHADNSHIYRNLVLREAGCDCVQYNHSNSNGNAQMYEFKHSFSGRLVEWSLLCYDREYHWGRQQKELFDTCLSASRELLVSGPLWTPFIAHDPLLDDKIKATWPEPEIKIVGLFNSTFGSRDSQNNENDHIRFLEGIIALAELPEFEKLRFVFRPKRDFDSYFVNGGARIRTLADKVLKHPHFLVDARRDFQSVSVIAACDLVVSMPFSSPTNEAIVSGRRGIYFDAANSYPNSYFDQYPDLVAHDIGALSRLVRHWLDASPDRIDAYCRQHVLPNYGGERGQHANQVIRAGLLDEPAPRVIPGVANAGLDDKSTGAHG